MIERPEYKQYKIKHTNNTYNLPKLQLCLYKNQTFIAIKLVRVRHTILIVI